jgi:hypothetical protein
VHLGKHRTAVKPRPPCDHPCYSMVLQSCSPFGQKRKSLGPITSPETCIAHGPQGGGTQPHHRVGLPRCSVIHSPLGTKGTLSFPKTAWGGAPSSEEKRSLVTSGISFGLSKRPQNLQCGFVQNMCLFWSSGSHRQGKTSLILAKPVL